MYNNSHIKWTRGIELTAEVFQHQDFDLDRRQQLAVRTILGDGKAGLLPGTAFNADGSFVDRSFEFPMLQCTALFPSGRIISVEEPLKITLPHLSGEEFFICLGFAEGEVHEFERDGIPYEGPVHELSIHTRDEIYFEDLLPLKRLVVKDDMLTVDADYIVPTLTTTSDKRIGEHINSCCDSLEKLLQNEKLENTDTHRALFYLLSLLKGTFIDNKIKKMRKLDSVLEILHELVFAIDFYIVQQMGSTLEALPEKIKELGDDPRKECDHLNIALFFQWVEEYLEASDAILEQYVVQDDSIDIDKLKEDIKAELTEELMQKLYDKLKTDLTESLTDEMTAKIREIIVQNVDQLRPELRDQLQELLRDPLYNDLYNALYEALSQLSYKPQEVVDTFVPLI